MMRLIFAALLLATVFSGCKKEDDNSNDPLLPGNLNNRTVGASAREFLSAEKYNTVSIEIDYQPGYAPNAAALDTLRNFFSLLLNKPGGILITTNPIAASGKTSLSIADISATEAANRTNFTTGTTLGVYVLYTDAPFTTANVLGVAYRNTSLTVFGPTVQNNSGGLNQPSRSKLEAATHEHEFAHLFGLVNLGSPMVTPHEDGSNQSHCNNNNCLMYFSMQTTVLGGMLMNNPIPKLDANCRADLTANGGR